MRGTAAILIRGLLIAVALVVSAWWALALALRLPGPPWVAYAVALAYALGMAVLLIALRPLRRALAVWAVGVLVLFIWWSTIRPSNQRDWAPDVAKLATAEVRGASW